MVHFALFCHQTRAQSPKLPHFSILYGKLTTFKLRLALNGLQTGLANTHTQTHVLHARLANVYFVNGASPLSLCVVSISMSEGDVFHEKQRLELCAIHALNNVLQERVFTKETADDICKR